MKFPNLTKQKPSTGSGSVYEEPVSKMPEPVKPFCFGQNKKHLIDVYGNRFDYKKCLGCRFKDGCNTAIWHETERYKKVLRVRRRIKRITRGRVPAEREDDLISAQPKVFL